MKDELQEALDELEADDSYWMPPEPERDRIEDQVLGLLCKEGKAHSSVALAADLYGSSEDVQETRPLGYLLVELILDDLNKKGLVTYRLGMHDVFVQIRPTRKGYLAMGMVQHWIHIANIGERHGRGEVPIHPGDTTDFRAYGDVATGNTCIKEDFIDHCSECDHLGKHLAQLREMYGTDQL